MIDAGGDDVPMTGPLDFGRPFTVLMVLGSLGVVSLIPQAIAQRDALPETLTEMPLWAHVLITVADPILLLLVAVPVGLQLAHGVGLTSLIADRVRDGALVWPCLRPQIPLAVVLGLLVSVTIVGLDIATAPLLGLDVARQPVADLGGLLLGMMYGGITEELLLRWGLMTLLVWVGANLTGSRGSLPGAPVFWTAIAVTAIAFGAAHLPAMTLLADGSFAVVVRTITLNAIGGIVFGWLFWRRSLEAAMFAHASAHVGLALFILAVG